MVLGLGSRPQGRALTSSAPRFWPAQVATGSGASSLLSPHGLLLSVQACGLRPRAQRSPDLSHQRRPRLGWAPG